MTSPSSYEVSQTSPVMMVGSDTNRTGLLGYGWSVSDPFIVTIRVTIAAHSVSVDADNFPGGLSCGECHKQIHWGGFACDAGQGYIICLQCGHNLDKLGTTTQDWQVGLVLFVGAVEGKDTSDYMPGQVQMYRSSNGELVIVLTNPQEKHTVRLVAPFQNMRIFLKNIVKVRDSKGLDLESMYLNQGVDELEKWANQLD